MITLNARGAGSKRTGSPDGDYHMKRVIVQAVLKGKRSWLIGLAALIVLAVVLLAGAYSASAQSRCASCHGDRSFVSATAASPHAKVACVACHLDSGTASRIGFGVQHLTGAVLRSPGDSRDRAAVPDSRCVACHKAALRGVVSANGIRISHSSCAVDRACTDCHSAVAHGTATTWATTYDMETCVACHATQGSKVSTACDLCHAGRTPAERVASGVFATTHGPNWRTTHGMGNAATCSVCHTSASCQKCHGPGLPHDATFLDRHAAVSTSPGARCQSCHQTAFCDDCHGLQMPHPAAFIKGHSAQATSNPALCQRCHAATDCTTCHTKHVHPGGAIPSSGAAASTTTGGN